MTSLWSFLVAHQTIVALVGYYLFSALVGGMPAPTANSGVAYKWTFASLNILASNISRAKSTTIENSPNWQAAVDQHLKNSPQVTGTPASGPQNP